MKRILSIIIGIIFIVCGAGAVIAGGYIAWQGEFIGLLLALGGVALAGTGGEIISKGDVWEAFRNLFFVLMRIS